MAHLILTWPLCAILLGLLVGRFIDTGQHFTPQPAANPDQDEREADVRGEGLGVRIHTEAYDAAQQ